MFPLLFMILMALHCMFEEAATSSSLRLILAGIAPYQLTCSEVLG